jgi:PIN domain nuclease of toxin-antitoxin system
VRLLLDTCTFLWLTLDDNHLSPTCRTVFSDADNEVFLSAASSWEICRKYSLGRLPLPSSPDVWIPEQRHKHGIDSLPVEEAATLHLPRLAELHRDPFDRIIVCQAIAHGLVVLTPDPLIKQYAVRVLW